MTRRFLAAAAVLLVLAAGPVGAAVAPAVPADRVVVNYFHGKIRCQACVRTEELSRATLDTHFKDEQAGGQVVFRLVNVQEGGNWHYMDDYKLDAWSLVLTREKGGKEVGHKVLTGTAAYLGDREKFMSHLWREIDAFMKVP